MTRLLEYFHPRALETTQIACFLVGVITLFVVPSLAYACIVLGLCCSYMLRLKEHAS